MAFKCTCIVPLVVIYWLLLHSCSDCVTLNSVDLDMPDFMDTWLITYSSPCSTTCGLGLRTQELCPLEATQANGTACHVRQVLCLDSWQCGLQTQTVAAGQHLELDCLEEVMEVLGPFSLMVSWRFARGVITTDENLFVRLEVPGLDRVVLDPVREKDAGTYCCDVQDSSFRRVKRMYKGVKVILPHVLSLDYTKGLKQWEKPGGMRPNISLATGKLYSRSTVQNMVLVSIATSMAIAVIIFICLKTFSYWKRSSKKNNPTSDAHLGTI